jgi:hypothetical protein
MRQSKTRRVFAERGPSGLDPRRGDHLYQTWVRDDGAPRVKQNISGFMMYLQSVDTPMLGAAHPHFAARPRTVPLSGS